MLYKSKQMQHGPGMDEYEQLKQIQHQELVCYGHQHYGQTLQLIQYYCIQDGCKLHTPRKYLINIKSYNYTIFVIMVFEITRTFNSDNFENILMLQSYEITLFKS